MTINNSTKIVATIGPITANKKSLTELYKAGMNVARLNGSHNNLEWHASTIRLLKKILPEVPILLDIPGKKIRTAQLAFEPEFDIEDEIILTTTPGFDGKEKVSINNALLHNFLNIGDTILADDGTLRFEVSKIQQNDIFIIAKNKGKLKSAKGINVPHVSIKGDLISIRDKEMMSFAVNHNVDFVGISFVESSKHIQAIRELCSGNRPRIVAKVENQGGLDNLEEIVIETDVVMIDRGDLSTETNMESIVIHQKNIINVANKYAKPVIVATEMLHTMIDSPIPTKAEVADISNAILDGAAATMLSGETAVGKFPIESVQTMTNISTMVNEHIKNKNSLLNNSSQVENIPKAMGDAISSLCNSLPITKIIAITKSGFAARMIAAQSLSQPIIAISNDLFSSKSFNMLRNTKGVYADIEFAKDSLEHLQKCLKHLWDNKEIEVNDIILLTAVGYPKSGRRMNIIQTHYVTDLKELFKWE